MGARLWATSNRRLSPCLPQYQTDRGGTRFRGPGPCWPITYKNQVKHMTLRFKQGMAASMLVAAGMAQAASVTIPTGTAYNGLVLEPKAAHFSFSADVLGTLDTAKTSVASYGAANTTVLKDTDGFYIEAAESAPITSLTIDTGTGSVQSFTTTGGFSLSTPTLKNVSSGGSLTVTDLNIDLANKKVYATLIGGNGVGTFNHLYLWDIASITGVTNVQSTGTYTTTLAGLSITTEGFNKFATSLGLLNLGKSALVGVTDYGTITVVAVPEPSTSVLMGLGLAGLLISKRRRQGRSLGR